MNFIGIAGDEDGDRYVYLFKQAQAEASKVEAKAKTQEAYAFVAARLAAIRRGHLPTFDAAMQRSARMLNMLHAVEVAAMPLKGQKHEEDFYYVPKELE